MSQSVVLSVPEITCDTCKNTIEGAVGPLEGVASAVVDIASRTVVVRFDTPATQADIDAAIEGAGYDIAGTVTGGAS
ncbi:heavy-metal-associated domain-containing protein [Catenulispora rubra]|uniref:heavy-metal-associated domain-containing protein n=1 Tax=Catenulispora rubra TaxID=280293 RepID=UPI0018924C22|nr:heavy metal-associated domain-containing protein [Catenulispora rubra]